VEAVVEGCRDLELFDVSQCKNLGRWLEGGGVERVGGLKRGKGRGVVFETVADGRWRTGK
jgi:F-box/leucine-rich repeat protein 7